jgi:rRNA maturation endonuclease Nob1
MPPAWEHTCGHVFEPRTHCAACGDQLEAGDLSLARVP